jgi:hypothetical protein
MAENRSSQGIFSANLHIRILSNLSHKLGADARPQKDVQAGRRHNDENVPVLVSFRWSNRENLCVCNGIHFVLLPIHLHFVQTGLGSTQPPIQWVPGALSPGVKRQWREADHPHPASAEVKKIWVYTFTPPYIFVVRCLINKHRDNFTFPITNTHNSHCY